MRVKSHTVHNRWDTEYRLVYLIPSVRIGPNFCHFCYSA